MPIQYPAILDIRDEGRRFSWTDRETMLYALAIGMGNDPLNRDELPFVYERELQALPTLATVVAWDATIPSERLGVDRRRTLHGEESLRLHRPMPPSGTVIADSRVVEAYDKGDKGAVIERQTVLTDADTAERIATITRTAFARGDGGFGGPSKTPPPHEVPARVPDVVLSFPTRRDQALLYRLCGDRNPLHADPDAARAAGFKTPILHGLCTYGICCRAVLQAYCSFRPEQLRSIAVRFSAPVQPGDTVDVKLWKDATVVSFEAEVRLRGVTVITNGRADLA